MIFSINDDISSDFIVDFIILFFNQSILFKYYFVISIFDS